MSALAKLHIGVDAEAGQILASELTISDVDDGSLTEPLLDRITLPPAPFIGHGAYDQAGISSTVAKRRRSRLTADAEAATPYKSGRANSA
jgi:hypothetical protein